MKKLLSLLVVGFGLLGFSSSLAGYVRPVGVFGYNPLIQSYDVNLTRAGNPLTQVLGITKQVFVVSQYNDGSKDGFSAWWWGSEGLPYVYSRSVNINEGWSSFSQGYINSYSVCDGIYGTGQSNMPGNCISNNVSAGTKDIIGGFLDSLTSNDYYYFDFTQYYDYEVILSNFCISSSVLGKSLCWEVRGDGTYTGSIGLSNNIDFDSLNTSYLYNPPSSNNNGNIDNNTPNEVNPDTTFTGSFSYVPCTVGAIIEYIEDTGVSPYLCRGGLSGYDDLTLTGLALLNPVPGSGEWLDSIYSHTNYDNVVAKQRFDYRNTSYVNQYVANQNVWIGKPAVLRSFFTLYNQYGGSQYKFEDIYEYCLLKKFVEITPSYSGSTYGGNYFKNVCISVNRDGVGVVSGNVVVGINRVGVGNIGSSGEVKTYNDAVEFIQNFFNMGKNVIDTRQAVGLGFLPVYIITFLMAIILFKFLRK